MHPGRKTSSRYWKHSTKSSDPGALNGGYLGGEALLRLAICLVLLGAGVRTAGPIGLALGIAPLVVAVPALWWRRDQTLDEPDVAWAELASVWASCSAPPCWPRCSSTPPRSCSRSWLAPDQAAEVGIFGAALGGGAAPLFLFQALQAVLLPALAALAVAQKFTEFRAGVRRMVFVVARAGHDRGSRRRWPSVPR